MRSVNHCHLAHPDPDQEQRELYACNIRYRLRHNLATQAEIKIELSKRSDEKKIRQILERLVNE